MLWRFTGPGVVAVAIGCGGKVIVDQAAASVSGTTSTSGAGGASGAVATSSSTGGDSGCPLMVPTQGSPCPNEKESCTYGMLCGSVVASCQNGTWNLSVASCPAMPCPSPPPKNGDPCPSGPAKCDYNLCNSGSPSTLDATCNDGMWSVMTGACPANCPPSFCGAGQICIVETNGDGVETFGCGNDPCSGTLDCVCAKQMCLQGYECAVIDATAISCTCANCR